MMSTYLRDYLVLSVKANTGLRFRADDDDNHEYTICCRTTSTRLMDHKQQITFELALVNRRLSRAWDANAAEESF